MEEDTFAADSNMSTDAASPYHRRRTLAEVHQAGSLPAATTMPPCQDHSQPYIYSNVEVHFFIQHLPRNPSIFSGEGAEDPHNWLKKYERVAKLNQWDETLCLANVYFYLTGTALKWFENNEESILTWKEFMSQLKSVFRKNENLRLRAEKTVKTRAQLKGESTEFYIQDVLRLCKEVDPHMNEEDKISHLMKGIAEELYQAFSQEMHIPLNNLSPSVAALKRYIVSE
ncbi:hypothetical protein LAZ67_2000731 [Cordylochernes scorpioides]|uniref:Retrotransposon gag domain-containing protein n=1 Tax=Cordylochernes scorpioides TaxID=51811 RepID=A0ABY6K2E2_9ARAC|nr:hypothetical protein LAZ67_2000731 [Cordylochernes scorpioides]